jgi:hypothetical protein
MRPAKEVKLRETASERSPIKLFKTEFGSEQYRNCRQAGS